MHIVPINIESEKLLLSNPEQLDELKRERPDLFATIVLSGDAGRLMRSYGKTLDSSIEPIESGLLFGKHDIESAPDVATGYHRQKALLEIADRGAQKSNISYRYLTLSGGSLTVTGEALFEGVVFDGVKLIAAPGARLSLRDCEFGSRKDYAVDLHEGAKVEVYESVRFIDCIKQFRMRLASRETAGCVIDFDDATAILDFLESNLVNAIQIDRDFTPAQTAFELRQPVMFINGANHALRFSAGEMTIEKDLALSGEFVCDTVITIDATERQSLSLSRFCGKLNIVGAETLRLSGCVFETSEIFAEDSEVILENCVLSGSNAITLTDSALSIQGGAIHAFNNGITYKSADGDETLFKTTQPKPSSLRMSGVSVMDCDSLFTSTVPVTVTIDGNCAFTQCRSPITAKECYIIARDSSSHGCVTLFELSRCTLEATNMSHHDDLLPYRLKERSAAKLSYCDMKECAEGVMVSKSKLTMIEDTFDACGIPVVTEKGDGIIEHLDCVFSNSKLRNFAIEHGNTLTNLKEFETCSV